MSKASEFIVDLLKSNGPCKKQVCLDNDWLNFGTKIEEVLKM